MIQKVRKKFLKSTIKNKLNKSEHPDLPVEVDVIVDHPYQIIKVTQVTRIHQIKSTFSTLEQEVETNLNEVATTINKMNIKICTLLCKDILPKGQMELVVSIPLFQIR